MGNSTTKYTFNGDVDPNNGRKNRNNEKMDISKPPPPSFNRMPPKSKGCMDDVVKFLWNPNTKEFLGRNAVSWAKILLFYLVFYSFLAGFFAVMMAVFYQTLDTRHQPKYTGHQSLLNTPGLGVVPGLHGDVITYQSSQDTSSREYVRIINQLIESYDIVNRAQVDYKNCTSDDTPTKREVCIFDLNLLGSSCSKEDNWGYTTSSPCIFLKLNKMINWKPEAPRSLQDLPLGLQEYINATQDPLQTLSEHVWVWCESEDSQLEQPAPGIPLYYFPYTNQEGYHRPLVPVRINATQDGVVVNCRAYGHNIQHKVNKRLAGEVNLYVKIEA
nr:sodium/potassium-transporting ATPase subunit beta-like [Procambarus clarkii]